ncbi:MAG: sulfotransferase family protein [Pseudomonadota bacterium]
MDWKTVRLKSFLAAKTVRHRLQPGGAGSSRVLLVPGVQRSGTNMIMEVLEQSWQTDVYHEIDRRAFENYALRDMATLKRVHARSGAELLVLKALLDAHRTRELLDAFSPSQALWIYRHFDDMVNSNMVSWPGGRNRIELLFEDPEKTGYRAKGMTPATLKTVKEHYRDGMNDASAIALFWYYRNQLFFDQKLDEDDRVVTLRYEDVVTKPHETLPPLFQALGLDFSEKCASFIHPRSIGKRPPPDILPHIRELCDTMMDRLSEAHRERGPS